MLWGFRGSGFGEVFVALDKTSSDLVAIKKVKVTMSSMSYGWWEMGKGVLRWKIW